MTRLTAPLVATLLLVGGSCARTPKEDAKAEETAVTVEVAPVTRGPIHRVVAAEAVLYPLVQANIVPKISAPVQKFFVNRGDHVRAGQLLARLENADLLAAAAESREQYQQARAQYTTTTTATLPEDLTKAQADAAAASQALEAAKRVYDNRVALLREGALAQKLVDDAKIAYVQAQSANETAQRHLQALLTVGQPELKKSARAQLEAAQAHYQNSEAQVSYSEIRSPIAGVVADRPVNVGELAANGSTLVSVMDISTIVARANVPVSRVEGLRAGKPATIVGPGGTELKGKVTVISPAVDPSTTTVEVWVQAVNPENALRPGTTARVMVLAETIPDALIVPASALLSAEEGGERVMVAGTDGLAHDTNVEIGVREGDEVQIVKGVKAGQQVITQGALGLDDRARIRLAAPGSKEGKREESGDTDQAPEKQ